MGFLTSTPLWLSILNRKEMWTIFGSSTLSFWKNSGSAHCYLRQLFRLTDSDGFKESGWLIDDSELGILASKSIDRYIDRYSKIGFQIDWFISKCWNTHIWIWEIHAHALSPVMLFSSIVLPVGDLEHLPFVIQHDVKLDSQGMNTHQGEHGQSKAQHL